MKASANSASLTRPTPEMAANSALVLGRRSTMALKVRSWKMMYAGTPRSWASDKRSSFKRLNSAESFYDGSVSSGIMCHHAPSGTNFHQ